MLPGSWPPIWVIGRWRRPGDIARSNGITSRSCIGSAIRRIFTRYDQLDLMYLGFVLLAGIFELLHRPI